MSTTTSGATTPTSPADSTQNRKDKHGYVGGEHDDFSQVSLMLESEKCRIAVEFSLDVKLPDRIFGSIERYLNMVDKKLSLVTLDQLRQNCYLMCARQLYLSQSPRTKEAFIISEDEITPLLAPLYIPQTMATAIAMIGDFEEENTTYHVQNWMELFLEWLATTSAILRKGYNEQITKAHWRKFKDPLKEI